MANEKRLRLNVSFSKKEEALYNFIVSQKNSSAFLKKLAMEYWKGEQQKPNMSESSEVLEEIKDMLVHLNLEILNKDKGENTQKHEQKLTENEKNLQKLEL